MRFFVVVDYRGESRLISGVITVENARELAAKSLAKRLENAAKLKEAAAITGSLSAVLDAQAETSGVFRANVHSRVRKQIQAVIEMLEGAKEAIEVERLSRSLSSLLEQDRILSGMPLPGTLRPSKERAKRHTSGSPEPESA